MTNLDEYVAYLSRQVDTVSTSFATPDSVATYLQTFLETVSPTYSGTAVEARGLGSGFQIGDVQYGRIGSNLSPQPYLGNAGGGAFEVLARTSQGSLFLDQGRLQIRDWFIGSSSAVNPTKMMIGSGTQTWNSGLTTLAAPFVSPNTLTSYVSEDNQYGNWILTLTSAQLPVKGTSSSVLLTSGIGFGDNPGANAGSMVVSGGATYDCQLGGSLTIEFFAKFFALGSTSIIMSNFNSDGSDGWEIQLVPPNISVAGFKGATQSWAHDLVANKWYHLAFVQQPGSFFMFRDGSKVFSTTSASQAALNTNFNFGVGKRIYNNTLPWWGSVEELRISNNVRYSGGAVGAFAFTVGSTEFTDDANTLGLWHFNEATGTVANDASSFANNGSLGGTYQWGAGSTYSGTSVNVLGSSFSEIGISGGKLYVYDSFPTATVGGTGSEVRFTATFRLGSTDDREFHTTGVSAGGFGI